MSLSTSPILAASASNDLAQVRWLIERENVPVDFVGDWYAEPRNGGKGLERQRRTPCMVAASHGSLEVLMYVLQMGADPNMLSEDEERCTAMHCAAAGGAALSTDSIKTLLLFGANRNARDTYGRVPADCLPTTTTMGSETNLHSSDGGGSSSGGSGSTGGNGRGHAGGAVSSQGILQDPDDEMLMSDEFRMYEFKIRRCSRTRAHDWTECPYTHPGEKARRRDPRRFNYCGTACPEFRKGSCPQGDVCEYAHGVFECWLHPSRYRTQLCKDGAACDRRACFFAHHSSQIRMPTDAFGNVLGNISPNTPSPTDSGSPTNGSPRQSSASLDWSHNRNSDSDQSTTLAQNMAMLKGGSMLGQQGAAANLQQYAAMTAGLGLSFPPLPRADSMLLQSQFVQQQQHQQHQQQQQNAQHQQRILANLASMNSMGGAFPMGGYSAMMQNGGAVANGMFNIGGDGNSMQPQQVMQQNSSTFLNDAGVHMKSVHQSQSNSASNGSSGSAVNQQTLQPSAQPYMYNPTLNGVATAMRRENSFQHLGMIEGVLDGDLGQPESNFA